VVEPGAEKAELNVFDRIQPESDHPGGLQIPGPSAGQLGVIGSTAVIENHVGIDLQAGGVGGIDGLSIAFDRYGRQAA
jgi:hypothetical protein